MQQAQQMQAKMQEAQAEIEQTEAEGIAGAGLVRVVLKGKGELVSVRVTFLVSRPTRPLSREHLARVFDPV